MKKIPYEVEQLFVAFYPGSDDNTHGFEDWVETVVQFHRGPKQKAIIKSFLDHLLSGEFSDSQLKDVWDSVTPSYNFSEGGHRVFLALIRDALERNTNTK